MVSAKCGGIILVDFPTYCNGYPRGGDFADDPCPAIEQSPRTWSSGTRVVPACLCTEIEIIDKDGRRASDGWKGEMPEGGSDKEHVHGTGGPPSIALEVRLRLSAA